MSTDAFKRMAAEQAMTFVDDGMRLGLGTGSTAAHFVEVLGERVAEGLKVVGVPTSEATRKQAEALNIPLTTLDETPFLDLTVDGADEIDGALRLIKGGGGALLREKIVATASERMVVIADGSKFVVTLGAFPLPIEVVPFGLEATVQMVQMLSQEAGCHGELVLRLNADGSPFETDGGHYIIDASFGKIDDPVALDEALKMIPGVVENGLFIGLADVAILGGEEGVRVLEGDESVS
ncbi:MAG: ribose-5-phosphate isomerase RpiA [Pseudomonadota bacterium]